MNKTAKGIMVITVVALFGISTFAFAGWGRGSGHMMDRGGWGPGYGHMMDRGDWGPGYGHMMDRGDWGPGYHHRGYGYGYGPEEYGDNLSAEEIAKLDRQRSEFFKDTENIRQQLYEKELALRSELARENPDTAKASSLQSDISKLRSDLDQKRLDYEIQARKSAPNADRGYRGYGPGMGYGNGGGYCRW